MQSLVAGALVKRQELFTDVPAQPAGLYTLCPRQCSAQQGEVTHLGVTSPLEPIPPSASTGLGLGSTNRGQHSKTKGGCKGF